MLTAEQVTKRFDGTPALNSVSFQTRQGGITALIGPSGCGKSTLLRLLIGLLTPDAGRVTFDGEPLGQRNIRALRHRMGYVIQSGGLFPHLTARDNVTLPARHLGAAAGWDAGAIRTRLAELVELTRFPEAGLDRHPGALSGGQRQRVSLMRALMLRPEVLLLDEPLGALDPPIRAELQRELRALFADLEQTVVLVTHDLAEAAYLARDDVAIMQAGTIEQRATFTEIREKPATEFVAEFVRTQTERVAALLGGTA